MMSFTGLRLVSRNEPLFIEIYEGFMRFNLAFCYRLSYQSSQYLFSLTSFCSDMFASNRYDALRMRITSPTRQVRKYVSNLA